MRGPLYETTDLGATEFGQQRFQSKIAFPSSSKVRFVEGRTSHVLLLYIRLLISFLAAIVSSAKLAKRGVAFFACRLLHMSGCLDNHFLPHRIFPAEEQVDSSGATIGSKRHQVEYEKAVSKVWQPLSPCGQVTTFYSSLIHYGNGSTTIKGQLYRPVVLLTRNPLPSVPTLALYLDGEPLPIHVSPYGSIVVTAEQRRVLTAYSLDLWRIITGKELRIAREVVNEKETNKELDLVYFVAEIKADVQLQEGGLSSEDIEWKRMETAVEKKDVKLDWRNLPDLEDAVIIDEAKNGCTLPLLPSRCYSAPS
jgi:endoribonuclease Dicer